LRGVPLQEAGFPFASEPIRLYDLAGLAFPDGEDETRAPVRDRVNKLLAAKKK
jgi:hypothetical protein